MGAEYELKYKGNPVVMESLPGPWHSISMETTYYDTPSRALSALRYTLRRRLENGVSICTLKTPGADGVRDEWEIECSSITESIEKLCKLGCPDTLSSLCAEGLVPVCGARFTRKIQCLELPGCTAELALDTGVLFGDRKEIPLCEIELELKSGSQEALDAFAEHFAAKYNLQTEHKSKFARALALCED